MTIHVYVEIYAHDSNRSAITESPNPAGITPAQSSVPRPWQTPEAKYAEFRGEILQFGSDHSGHARNLPCSPSISPACSDRINTRGVLL